MAQASTEFAPGSARAWIALCAGYFQAGGGAETGRENPNLDKAIDTCARGAAAAPYALNSTALLVVMKTIRGDVSQQDWERLHERL